MWSLAAIGALSGRRHVGGRAALILPAVLLSAGVGLGAGDASTRPASRPAWLSAARTQPAPLPAVRAGTVDEALAYRPDETTILQDVRDRDGQLDAPALYVLLRRAAMLPDGPELLAEADRPNVKNLWRSPEGYRGKLVAVKGRFVQQKDWSDQATPTRWWAKPVYAAYVQETATGEGQTLIVMLAHRPGKIGQGAPVRVAGLFYKLVTLPEKDKPGQTGEFPVLVAGQLFGTAPAAGGGMPAELYVVFGLVMLLLLGFALVRRRTSRSRRGVSEYKPLRFEDAAEGAPGGEAGEGEPVDAELVRQVKAFEQRREHSAEGGDADDGTDSR